MSLHPLELELLAHRYLYYVLDSPLLSDYEYDMLERRAKKELPADSVIHSIGSDCVEDYPIEAVSLAKCLHDDSQWLDPQ